ncbi:MAG: amino acid adenylation domain-containing protein [Magnetococcales bacterium]|nr:amino acid adenylation domain-containing protein [Magnetococcales bacterium]
MDHPIDLGDELGLQAEWFPQPIHALDNALSVNITEIQGELVVEFDYSTERFDAETLHRWSGHFRTLLAAIVAGTEGTESDRTVQSLSLLTPEEREQRLVTWNRPLHRSPHHGRFACLHQGPERWAAETPEAMAVMGTGSAFTYGALNARANRLAHHLIALGIGPDRLVAILPERSPEMIVLLLAILKAGGGYLPLDPESPAHRLALMLDDARPQLLLTHRALRSRLPETKVPVIVLEELWPSLTDASEENPRVPVEPSHPAYVIYTSGSTGVPKGVVVAHEAIVSHCLDYAVPYRIGPADRVLQFAALHFDFSVEDIFTPLLAGAALVVRGNEIWPPDEFNRQVREHGITVAGLTPAYFQQLVLAWSHQPEELPLESLRAIGIGGDALSGHLIEALRQTPMKGVALWNAYGPTEAVVTHLIHPIAADDDPTGRIPIGRPLGRRRAYILDRNGSLQPVGVPGELYLGGAELALGYLNRPELTAEKFLPDPFNPEPGARMYRTGDRACYRENGWIDFLGRIDSQVKVRGFRVELGEIETLLSRHAAIREAVVHPFTPESGKTRLAAYVVFDPEADSRPTEEQLLAHLQDRLPYYMIPDRFLVLESLPLTSSGKLDRRHLPVPEEPEETASCLVETMPDTATERILADIWSTLLRQERIGIHHNFFDLGGHSLLAVQVLSQVRDRLGVELAIGVVFQYPTIAGLAERIDAILEPAPTHDDPSDPEREEFVF